MRWSRFTWIALLIWPLLGLGQVPSPSDRRAQIRTQRDAVEAQHRRALQACAREFAQTACTEQARRDRRREMDGLDAELATLDQAERQRRTAERTQRVGDKQRAADQRASQASAPAASSARVPRAAASAASGPHRRTPEVRAAAASAAAEVASTRQQARGRRLAEQQAHADTVRKRNAERAQKRAPSPPLPAAPAASAPGLR